MNSDIPSPLLSFLGACLYGNAVSFYKELNDAERAELESQGKRFGLTVWFYRYLFDILPEEKRVEYQKSYRLRALQALIGRQELKRFYNVLASERLRFVPIKGADLAYRLYPDAALRPFRDWDIWFHPDDCERALKVLKEDGWRIPELFTDEQENAIKSSKHHFSPHLRGQFIVEPHYTLANFRQITPYKIWDETIDYSDGDGQRVLSPELNLLMLARHASTQSYYHVQLPKLLTDAAVVLLKENVNFAKLRSMAAYWHLPYPGDMLAAFPEFFPSSEIARFGATPRTIDEIRQLFELRGELGNPKNAALLLGRFEARGQVAGGLMKHIWTLKPGNIRVIFRLPKHGAWGRVICAYVSYFWSRSRQLLDACIQRNPKMRKYTSLIEKIESD